MNVASFLVLLLASLLVSGCGRPPSAGGPPGDFPVNAVVAAVQTGTVVDRVNVVGSLRARDAVDVVAEINGTVEEILFLEGEPAVAGQPLVRLDDAKVQARAAEAEARFNLADTNRRRAEELLATATISRQEYDQVVAEFGVAESVWNLLKQDLDDALIKAPFDGLLGARYVSPGQYVSVGQSVTRLVKMDPLEVEFRVPERAGPSIALGQRIEMSTVSGSGALVKGEVFFIDPVVDAQSRTVLVKALIPNQSLTLKPGMYGHVAVMLGAREAALVIPESAVRYRGDQAYVVTVDDEQKAEFRNIRVGLRMDGKLEVVEGLSAGERVVIEGFQKMGPGTTVIVSPSSSAYGVTP